MKHVRVWAQGATPSLLSEGKPSRTAQATANLLATHQFLDQPKIFDDPLAFAGAQTSSRNYPGSCSQREPKRPKHDDVRNADWLGFVCCPYAAVAIWKGLITQRSLTQSSHRERLRRIVAATPQPPSPRSRLVSGQ